MTASDGTGGGGSAAAAALVPVGRNDDDVPPVERNQEALERFTHAYLRFTKGVHEFLLQGNGYVTPVNHKSGLDRLVDKEDSLEAKVFNPVDEAIAGIDPEMRTRILKEALKVLPALIELGKPITPEYLAAAQHLKKEGEEITLESLAGAVRADLGTPDDLRTFISQLSYVEPVVRDLIDEMTPKMRAHIDDYFNLDFWTHASNVHENVLSGGITFRYRINDQGKKEKIGITSLPYTLEAASQSKVPNVIRDDTTFSRGHKQALVTRFKKAGSPLRLLLNIPIHRWHKRDIPNELDYAEYAVGHTLLKGEPEYLELLVDGRELIRKYHAQAAGDAEAAMAGVARNLGRVRSDHRLPSRPEGEAAKGRKKEKRPTGLAARLLHDEYIGGVEEECVRMMHDHDRFATRWRTFVLSLTKPRTPAADDEDARNEGLLCSTEGRYYSLERLLNSVDNAGWFYHIADVNQERVVNFLRDYLPNQQLMGVGSDTLGKYHQWLQNSHTKRSGINFKTEAHALPPYMGWVLTFFGPRIAWAIFHTGWENLRDEKEHFTLRDFAGEVTSRLSRGPRGWWDLYNDFRKKKDLPDPSTATLSLVPRIEQALHEMRPQYLRPADLDGMRELLIDMGYHDFRKERDNPAFRLAAGMLNARVNAHTDYDCWRFAYKQLMTSVKWADKGIELSKDDDKLREGLPLLHKVRTVAFYELSLLYGHNTVHNDDKTKENLLAAWDASQHYARDRSPVKPTLEEEVRTLQDPMNYDRRVEHLLAMKRAAPSAQRYTTGEIEKSALQAYTELSMILESRPNIDETYRGHLEGVRQRIYADLLPVHLRPPQIPQVAAKQIAEAQPNGNKPAGYVNGHVPRQLTAPANGGSHMTIDEKTRELYNERTKGLDPTAPDYLDTMMRIRHDTMREGGYIHDVLGDGKPSFLDQDDISPAAAAYLGRPYALTKGGDASGKKH